MLKRLVNCSSRALLYNKPTAKLSELKEYACLIESLNENASAKAVEDYQQLTQKYDLSPEELTYLFRVINIEPELLKQSVPQDAWRREIEFHNYQWRRSRFYASGQTLEQTVEALKQKYPDVANYDTRHPERVQAYKTLENIFLKDGPKPKNVQDEVTVARFAKEFEKRINSHIAELKRGNSAKTVDDQNVHSNTGAGATEVDAINEISDVLKRINQKLQSSPAYVYGSIVHFFNVHRNRLGEPAVQQFAKPQATTKSLKGSPAKTEGGIVERTLDEGNDLPLILEEQNKQLREGLSYNFLPWINDRKLIYEAQADRGNTLLYGALAGIFGSYFLWKLYQGDATNTSLVALLAATAFFTKRYRSHTFRNSFDYLVQLNVHRDGRTLDLFIQKPNNQITKIEGVPLTDFKVHRTDYEFDLPSNRLTEAVHQDVEIPKVKLSDLRKLGVGRDSWVATYGQDLLFVPISFKGNVALFNSLAKGQELKLGQ